MRPSQDIHEVNIYGLLEQWTAAFVSETNKELVDYDLAIDWRRVRSGKTSDATAHETRVTADGQAQSHR